MLTQCIVSWCFSSFSHAVCAIHFMHVTLHGSRLKCLQASTHTIFMPSMVSCPLIVSSICLSPCFSPSFTSLPIFCLHSALHSFFHMDNAKVKHLLHFPLMRSIVPWRKTILPHPDHEHLSGGLSFNKMNLVKPVHASDSSCLHPRSSNLQYFSPTTRQ